MSRRLMVLALLVPIGPLTAQHPPGRQGSSNVRVMAHLPLGGNFSTTDIEIEQDLSRPYAYVTRRYQHSGFDVINIKDPARAYVMYSWRMEKPELHQGSGALAPAYVKTGGRYYFVQSYQYSSNGLDADVGMSVFDVTGLPDTTKVKEVRRVKTPDTRGGFHEIFAYKHSTGQALVFTTGGNPGARVYDIAKAVSGDSAYGMVARVPNPMEGGRGGYHDFYVGFDPASQQDRFYGAGAGGYHVYDVTNLQAPKLLTSITGFAGLTSGHTFTPTPDGRYAVTELEYQYAPLRIFDLKPGLDGEVKAITRPIGAWMTNWKNLPHNHEVRWPYVFVSDYEDGLSVFNMMDPTNPYTVGYYDTYDGPHQNRLEYINHPSGVGGTNNGAFGIDVRNADGLIVISDMTTGFWAFKMDGFDGWNGHQWGMPNNSSAQDWDNGPDGLQKKKVS
jgi:hypothetical protein